MHTLTYRSRFCKDAEPNWRQNSLKGRQNLSQDAAALEIADNYFYLFDKEEVFSSFSISASLVSLLIADITILLTVDEQRWGIMGHGGKSWFTIRRMNVRWPQTDFKPRYTLVQQMSASSMYSIKIIQGLS